MTSALDRLAANGMVLDDFSPFPPAVLLKKYVMLGRFVHTSGHLPDRAGQAPVRGQLGRDLDVEQGVLAARDTAANLLTTLREAAGDLDRVARVVKIFGMVNATPTFTEHAAVIDGASSLFENVWGPDRGIGIRSAVGVSSLPLGAPVEIELVVELLPEGAAA